MDLDKIIINRPSNQSRAQKTTSIFLTVVAWTVWSYLWLPLLGVLGWYLGFEFFQSAMKDSGWKAFLAALPSYLEYIALTSGTLVFWALINWARFKGVRDKRALGDHKQVTAQEQAHYLDVSEYGLTKWKNTKRLVAMYFKSGKLSHMVPTAGAAYTGIPAIDDGDMSARFANDLYDIVQSIEEKAPTPVVDVNISMTLEEEFALNNKKLEKLYKLEQKYVKDLNKLAEYSKPHKIVPLFAAQKRRLEAVKDAIAKYESKHAFLECEALEKNSVVPDSIKKGSSVIVDGTLFAEQ